MNGIDNLDSIRSSTITGNTNNSGIYDVEYVPSRGNSRQNVQTTSISPQVLNADEPQPAVRPGRQLEDVLRSVDGRTSGRVRLPLEASRTIASIRIIPDSPSRDTHNSEGKSKRSARSYKPQDIATRRPANNASESERAYIWRQKFQRLHQQNRTIEIPDTNDPDALERMYSEALRTHHYARTSPTWLIYMGLGYSAFQFGLSKLGFKLPADFVFMQLDVMSHYPELLKALGDPGGPSIGSNWPPWMKLTFVIAVQTLIFVIVYKVSGNNSVQANSVQKFICSTGLMGGKPQGDEVTTDQATNGLGGMLGGLLGNGGGGGGLGSLLGSGGGLGGLISGMMGALGGKSSMDDIDLENPPPPVSDDEAVSPQSRGFNSRRPGLFD